MPAEPGFTTQLDYAWITCDAPASTVKTTLTVTNLRGQTVVFDLAESSVSGTDFIFDGGSVPASARTTFTGSQALITLSLASASNGGDCAIVAKYSFED